MAKSTFLKFKLILLIRVHTLVRLLILEKIMISRGKIDLISLKKEKHKAQEFCENNMIKNE